MCVATVYSVLPLSLWTTITVILLGWDSNPQSRMNIVWIAFIIICLVCFLSGGMFGVETFGPSVDEFQKRFDPETTDGEGPIRLKNLYFTYLVVLRALAKTAPLLGQESFYTGLGIFLTLSLSLSLSNWRLACFKSYQIPVQLKRTKVFDVVCNQIKPQTLLHCSAFSKVLDACSMSVCNPSPRKLQCLLCIELGPMQRLAGISSPNNATESQDW